MTVKDLTFLMSFYQEVEIHQGNMFVTCFPNEVREEFLDCEVIHLKANNDVIQIGIARGLYD